MFRLAGFVLTAVEIAAESFSAIWRRKPGGDFVCSAEKGALVNLELPMRASGRFDGHVVQGHVDGVGTVISFAPVAK